MLAGYSAKPAKFSKKKCGLNELNPPLAFAFSYPEEKKLKRSSNRMICNFVLLVA